MSFVNRFAVIIPVHNALEDLKRCLHSIEIKTTTPITLILINDASDESTTSFLIEYSKRNNAIYAETNKDTPKGFSRASNLGITLAKGADYYCILNSDTIIGTAGWNDKIMFVGDSHPDTGILSVVSNCATSQTLFFPKYIKITKIDSIVQSLTDHRYPTIALPNGFCYIIKKQVVCRIGMFDASIFPHYGSEDHYSLVARKANIISRIVDDVFIWHKGQASYGQERDQIVKETIKRLKREHGDKFVQDLVKTNCEGLSYLRERIIGYFKR